MPWLAHLDCRYILNWLNILHEVRYRWIFFLIFQNPRMRFFLSNGQQSEINLWSIFTLCDKLQGVPQIIPMSCYNLELDVWIWFRQCFLEILLHINRLMSVVRKKCFYFCMTFWSHSNMHICALFKTSVSTEMSTTSFY